jgi:hypothetical protein
LALVFRRRKPSPPRLRLANPNRVAARYNPGRSELARVRDDLPKSLTAAGEKVTNGQATYLRRLIMPWQIRAFGYYDLVGEFKFAAQYYARSLSQLRLFAAELNDDGEVIPTENEQVIQALARIKDPGGSGTSGLLADYGRLMFLTGEAILFVTIDERNQLEQWEMLSTDEIRLLDGNYTRFMAPTLPATLFRPAPDDAFEPVQGTAVAYRLHKRHPRFSSLSDSTTEGVLDILEELVLLTQVVRARVRSRLAGAGVLFLDDRITTTPSEPTPDEDPLEDPFIEDFTEAIMSPITDEGTASAVVPLVARVRVPDGCKLADLVYHLQVVDPMQIYPETGLRTECIRRLAMALDMPAEALLGFTDLNHWNAWIVDEISWKAHLQPIADGCVQDLTVAYLTPYLRDELKLTDWQKYLVAYDASKVINHPDRSKNAIVLHDKGIVGDEAVRRETGFTEDDAPNKDELARAVGIATRDSSLAWNAIPSIRSGGLEPEPGVVEQGGTTTGTPVAAEGADVEKGPPRGSSGVAGDEGLVGSLAQAVLMSQIEGAAQLALLRAREAAGAKLLTAVRKLRDADASAAVEGVRTRDVAAALGRARVKVALGQREREEELVAGARDLIVEALRLFGVTDETAASLIADTIEAYASRTLYEARPQPLPPNFSSYVTGLLATASRNGG